jgi:glucose/arabinose dehydrogenase
MGEQTIDRVRRPAASHVALGVAMALTGTVSMAAEVSAQNTGVAAEYGFSPQLPEPDKSIIPTVKIAKAVGWPANTAPTPAAGLQVSALAQGLHHPRWLYVLPNGDVLVAETEAPLKPDDSKGISNKVHAGVMKRAGSGAHPSANEITLLRAGASGHAEAHTFLQGLNAPIGMTLVGHTLYVADTDAVLKFPYHDGDTQIRAEGQKVTDLPAGTLNHHWTKSLVASPDGSKLYVGVGSNSNAAENGLAAEFERAAVWEIDVASGKHRVFAGGLRNPVGLAWEPDAKALWVSVNERDELGDHLPPDYMTSLHEGAFYGWPYSYYGQHVDHRVKPQDPAKVAFAVMPDYALGAHTASLGLCWSGGATLPKPFEHGMFVGQHGSWNRNVRSGYKVIFVAFQDDKPVGMPVDVLTGFLDDNADARGRPVGVAIDKQGALLVADDVGNTVWRVTALQAKSP